MDSEDEPDLSSSDLHDLVQVTTAGNDFEAVALIDALDEVGIPAIKRGGLIHFGQFATSDIMVPRKLLSSARDEIERFRTTASERGVSDAFSEKAVSEQITDLAADPLTIKMLALASMPLDERLLRLEENVAHWLADGTGAPETARNLAAAGLTQAQAEKLVSRVKFQRKDLVIDALNNSINRGLCIAAFGPVFLFIPIPFNGPAVVCVMTVGFCLAWNAWGNKREIEKITEETA